jgi:hypothetical protein
VVAISINLPRILAFLGVPDRAGEALIAPVLRQRTEFAVKVGALMAGGVFDAGVMPESDGEPFSLLVAAVAAHLKQRGATWPSVSSAPPGVGGLLFRRRSPEPPNA